MARAPHGPFSIETLELADPRPDEILVRLVATGVCHTDIAMRDQAFPVPQPIVLGHEGAGIVERVGANVTKVAPGDHVIMSYNSCGVCRSCLANATSYCYDFFGRNFAGARADQSSPLSLNGTPIHGNFFGQSSFASHAIAILGTRSRCRPTCRSTDWAHWHVVSRRARGRSSTGCA